jgi:hypothetical protein
MLQVVMMIVVMMIVVVVVVVMIVRMGGVRKRGRGHPPTYMVLLALSRLVGVTFIWLDASSGGGGV